MLYAKSWGPAWSSDSGYMPIWSSTARARCFDSSVFGANDLGSTPATLVGIRSTSTNPRGFSPSHVGPTSRNLPSGVPGPEPSWWTTFVRTSTICTVQ